MIIISSKFGRMVGLLVGKNGVPFRAKRPEIMKMPNVIMNTKLSVSTSEGRC